MEIARTFPSLVTDWNHGIERETDRESDGENGVGKRPYSAYLSILLVRHEIPSYRAPADNALVRCICCGGQFFSVADAGWWGRSSTSSSSSSNWVQSYTGSVCQCDQRIGRRRARLGSARYNIGGGGWHAVRLPDWWNWLFGWRGIPTDWNRRPPSTVSFGPSVCLSV